MDRMRSYAFAALFALAGAGGGLVRAQPAVNEGSLVFRVDRVRSDRGVVRCRLFAGANGFPSDARAALRRAVATIRSGAAACEFHDLAPGSYAIASFHDENGNGELDRNFIGIPSEGTAASNDARGTMGPPSFADARFRYGGGTLVSRAHMVY